jgi:hypothetical protein
MADTLTSYELVEATGITGLAIRLPGRLDP